MTLPANIRLNVKVNFPAYVVGAGPIAVNKLNGIWTISLNAASLIELIPPVQNFPTDFLIVWDSLAKSWFALSLAGALAAVGTGRVQRSVTTTPIIVGTSDQILNVAINAGTPNVPMPAASSRNGLPLTVFDAGGFAGTHNITVTPNGADTIVNASNPALYTLDTNFQEVTFTPFNDGVNAGWFIS